MPYYKFEWNEINQNLPNEGTSIWYVEIEKGLIVRQITLYSSGIKNKYDEEFQEDEYGGLGLVTEFNPIEYDNCVEIDAIIFNKEWG